MKYCSSLCNTISFAKKRKHGAPEHAISDFAIK
jgi:hypothetical protein